METTETNVVPAPELLSKAEVISAATNNPTLSPDEFVFGGRTFKVVHLAYDQYIEFISKLEPLLGALTSKLSGRINEAVNLPGITLTGSDFSASFLLKFCGKELPSMAAIVCNMQAIAAKKPEQEVTAEWIKENAQDPFELVNIIAAQINKNSMIVKFASFFLQMLPLLQRVKDTGSTLPAK